MVTCVRQGSVLHRLLQASARWGAPLAALVLAAAVFLLKEPETPGPWFSVF